MNNLKIFGEIHRECQRQIDKFGDNSWPSVVTKPSGAAYDPEFVAREYDLPREKEAKDDCEYAFDHGFGTWAHIAVEEMVEAVAAKDDTERRKELVQLAAVVVSWIRDIDRKTKLPEPSKIIE